MIKKKVQNFKLFMWVALYYPANDPTPISNVCWWKSINLKWNSTSHVLMAGSSKP